MRAKIKKKKKKIGDGSFEKKKKRVYYLTLEIAFHKC